MSRYLEEAAAVLRKADQDNSTYFQHEKAMDVARGFSMLAAVDKGLLPVELLADVIAQFRDRA
ncbi:MULTISPECIES: hypothetical protein [unclassified Streptomyces]|uniref:hypothetical protein n=1 Tax=unclassified Streptomyces TaxID=2593676 RepID=UPI0022588E11|nr:MULTISPECIES: hypothetical protein [unclassified Streptomyces]MCX4871098.1 hypothetical protein [Streptomyces sp. NBC_00906]MCX4902720.1 hypothetical protein [Streptomyces sp. NBC_00892]